MTSPKEIKDMIESAGGEIKEMNLLPDGHGFAVASFPLPKDHWIYEEKEKYDAPPMPFRMGSGEQRNLWAEKIRAAGKYAIRASTMNGKDMDFDPDAMLQNLIVGLLGYWTDDGLTDDDWALPDPIPSDFQDPVALCEKQEKALQLFQDWHWDVFCSGRPLEQSGKSIDHTRINEVHGMCERLGIKASELTGDQK